MHKMSLNQTNQELSILVRERLEEDQANVPCYRAA